MLNWYQRVILPRLLDSEMGSKEFEETRSKILEDVSGVVLEIGVGPGYNIPHYKNISKLYALEPSKELIGIARPRAKGRPFPVEFLQTGAEHIPLPDNSIDTAVSTWTLCSVNNPEQVLQEVARVLRPGGRFVFVDHGASPHTGTKVVQTLYTQISKYFTGNCHCDRYIETLIKQAGFNILKIEHPKEKFRPLIYNYEGVAQK